MALFEQISEDIKAAMKARDKVALETLRNVKKVFLEAKTAPGANDTLTDDDALKLMQKLVKQGKDAAQIYVGQNRQDLAQDAQRRRAGSSCEADHRGCGCHQHEGYGQGDGYRHQAASRQGRRPCHQ